VCEVPGWGRVLDAPTVLGEMAELGLLATELGAPGYLPRDPVELRALLGVHGLKLIGGFLAIELHQDPHVALAAAEDSAALFAACGAEVLVLAAATGLDGYVERPELIGEQWWTLIDTAGRIAAVSAKHGLRTVLHPHVGTHIGTEAEVERYWPTLPCRCAWIPGTCSSAAPARSSSPSATPNASGTFTSKTFVVCSPTRSEPASCPMRRPSARDSSSHSETVM
jgi:hypothetical protein